MKVICIDDKNDRNGTKTNWRPVFMKIYNVLSEELGGGKDGLLEFAYRIVEDPNNDRIVWSKWRFAPISDIDETEFVRDYNKQEA